MTYLWSSFFICVSSRQKYHVNVRHIIYDHRSSCFCLTEIKTVPLIFDRCSMIIVHYLYFTDINTVSLMFGSWSMISILHMCVFQTSYRILIVWHIIYDFPSICLNLPEFNSVFIVWHFICEHRCFCLCHPEINTVPLTFDILSIIIVVYVCVLQR